MAAPHQGARDRGRLGEYWVPPNPRVAEGRPSASATARPARPLAPASSPSRPVPREAPRPPAPSRLGGRRALTLRMAPGRPGWARERRAGGRSGGRRGAAAPARTRVRRGRRAGCGLRGGGARAEGTSPLRDLIKRERPYLPGRFTLPSRPQRSWIQVPWSSPALSRECWSRAFRPTFRVTKCQERERIVGGLRWESSPP